MNPSNVITAPVTFSYVQLFEPKPDDKGVLKYSCQLLLSKDDKEEKARWDECVKAAVEKGIANGKFSRAQIPTLKLPIRDGDKELATEQKKGEEYKNVWFVNTMALHQNPRTGAINPPPEVTKPQSGAAVPILDQTEFFSGCLGRAIISFYPYKSDQGAKGVAIAINGAYKMGEGARLDGRVSATSAFADFAKDDSENETDPADQGEFK